ncbi:Ig-like domain-containing protein [Hymenobacter negativus]|uniref:T9SS type A sorting domain-containing protein n=1 Tax=Hymenobacter negativus TaxID=2795026 RepID=A0ABS0Q7L3_9BACT|nr:T9SS type A sorting domain-containing protein [Hymenobacter negativus]MBH8558649.1 T9SS type A sorting domain-containing protein [Hymenobacter negativus]
MHKPFLANRLSRWLTVAVLALLSATSARAQLTGTKAIPGDYATVAAAISALNAGGVGAGGVTFNIAAGYTETFASPTAGAITATGTAANPIAFLKSGSGANPLITAGVGTTTNLDAIISLSGSDYVTFDGISLAESAANTTATTQMEFGIALFRPSATDGCQYNVIRNCVITLNKANTGTFGIYGAASTAALATSVAATAPSGANSYNKINGNTVSNAVSGMYLTGSTSTAAANYDLGNEIGVTAGNTVTNFGGVATSGWGIGVNIQNGAKIANNTVNSNGGTAGTSTLRGIYGNTGTSSNIDITNNTVTLAGGATTSSVIGIDNSIGSTAASNTVNITGNTIQNSTYATSTTGAFYGIQNTATAAVVNLNGNTISGNASTSTSGTFMALRNTASAPTLNINNNVITNNTLTGSGEYDAVYNSGTTSTAMAVNGNQFSSTAALATTGSVYFLQNSISNTGTVAMQNNTFGSFTKSGAGGTVYGYYNNSSPTATQTISGNTMSNITLSGATNFYGTFVNTSSSQTSILTGNTVSNITGGTSAVYGLYIAYGTATSTVNTNVVTGLSAAASVYGLYLGSSLQGGNTYGNTISALTASGASSTVYGLYTAAVSPNIYTNKIYNLANSDAAGVVYGVYETGGTTTTLYNNLVGDLRATASTNLNAVVGLFINSGTTANTYYNTFYLAASSTGATFGTSGIYLGSTSTTLDARNNIVVNKSTAVGTGGYTAALRRVSGTAGTAPANYATTSNNNALYAGTPSATNLIYVEGTTTATNAQQTLAAYKAFMGNRDQQAVTEDVPFLSTTGTAATFLHVNPAVATQVEGGGTPVSGITTDFDGDTRNASTPDIGADEGAFTPQDLTGPSITFTALGNTSSTGDRTLTATITDPSGISTSAPPRIFYRKGTSGAFTSALATSSSGSSYTFTISATALGGLAAGDVVQYYVVAQDVPGNVSSNPAGGTFTAAPATPASYQILSILSGTYYVTATVGSSLNPAKEFATLTAAATAYNNSGLSGAVNFVLLDATYSTGETFPIVFGNNLEASATNTLTIRPGTGVTSAITAASSVLAFLNARYITVDGSNVAGGTTRNLTVTSTSTTAGAYGIGLISTATTGPGNQFITLRNTNVVGGSNTAATFGIYVGNGPDNDNITVTNNTVQGSYYGIYAFGSATTSAGGMDNLVVSNNVVGPATASATANIGTWGMLISNAIAPSITGNEVQNVSSANANNIYGIYLVDSKNAVLSRNAVHNISYTGTSTYKVWAINSQNTNLSTAANPSAVRIVNNLVYAITSTTTSATWNTVGINLSGGYSDQIVYNTVYLSGALSAASGTAGSAAFANGNPSVTSVSTNIDVRNNIFAIIGGTGGTSTTPLYAHYEYGSSVTGSTLNYNDLYVTVGATGSAQIGRLNSTDYATLAAWQTATGQEANSVSADPQFTQTATVPYNLTPTSAFLNGAATPITGVTVDYTGATRGTTPDIGAYEFTPPACQAVSNLAFTGITPTTASITFTAPTGANSYTVTYTPAGGTATTVTPNPTGSPVALTGLTASTTYTVTVTTNCTGATSPSATGTFRTACAPPTYATLPATEGFENTWLSRCDTREVPSASWLNTPTTGNNSWRRDDDGASANWTSATSGSFSPAGSQGSAHAARFHSYYTASGVMGTLDYYVDLSATGTKRLTFDYVNVSTAGSKLEVLLSTDGGTTFTSTPLLSVATSSTFSTKTVDLTATSATSVIRFRATGDFGSYDIGLDNVQVRVLPNVDLAATALVAPTATQGCYSSTETVTVAVSNLGAQALDFSVNPATVTATVTTPTGPQTLNGSITTGTLAVGATQNVTLTPTLNMAAVGTYTFAISATVTGDGNTANDALAPAPTRTVVAPVAGTLSPASSSLCVSGTAALSLTGAANGNIQYQSSSDNVTFTDVTGATSAAYTTPVLTSTTYYRAQVRCGTAVATSNVSTITVTNPLVASTNTPVAICSGSTATLTATATAGNQVRFFDVATGGTALTTTTPGSYTTPALTASTTYYAEAYISSSSVAGLADNSASNGTFVQSTLTDYPLGFAVSQAGTLASVDVYPSAAGSLTITLYRTTGSQPAGTTTAVAGSDVTINVTAAQVGTRVTVPLNYALAAGEYRISNSSGTLGRFSTYTGTYPLTSGPLTVRGSYTAATSTSFSNTTYNSFFNLTFTSECAGATRTAIQVNVTQPATASFAAATGSSCGTSAVALAGSVGGSATGGTYTSSGTGTFSPNATTLTATYTPSAADVTAGSVTITLTSAGSTPCPAATATFALSISRAPVASFSYPAATTYCAGSTSTVSPTLGSGATAGTFSSTSGLTINATTGVITLASSTAGTYTVTNTVAASGACAAVSATTTVTITPATSATFAYSTGTFCASGTNPTPTVTGTAGGTFSSTTGLSLNATTGAINLSASTPGTYTVTYTVAGACGSSSTQSVTITTASLATFSYGTPATYCVSGTTNPTPSFGTGASGGVFSSTTGLTINATTGVITLSSSTPGTYTVTNTIAASGGCAAATATTTVTITAAPTASFSYATTAGCAGSTTAVTPTLGTGATAGTFSSTTGLVINATTGAINLATSTAGTYTVTNTVAAAGGCAAATATATFTVNPRPATPTISVVYNGTTTTLTSSATTGNQWYLNGNLITGATGQTYVVNGLPAQYGSYTVVVTNANGCTSLPSAPLVITSAKSGIAGASLQVYPNPTPTGQMTLELTGYRLATQLTVLDALGRVIISELLPANAGTATHTLNLKDVATGVYLLRLRNADGVETRRLVRE